MSLSVYLTDCFDFLNIDLYLLMSSLKDNLLNHRSFILSKLKKGLAGHKTYLHNGFQSSLLTDAFGSTQGALFSLRHSALKSIIPDRRNSIKC